LATHPGGYLYVESAPVTVGPARVYDPNFDNAAAWTSANATSDKLWVIAGDGFAVLDTVGGFASLATVDGYHADPADVPASGTVTFTFSEITADAGEQMTFAVRHLDSAGTEISRDDSTNVDLTTISGLEHSFAYTVPSGTVALKVTAQNRNGSVRVVLDSVTFA
jgi:hypothetical protein